MKRNNRTQLLEFMVEFMAKLRTKNMAKISARLRAFLCLIPLLMTALASNPTEAESLEFNKKTYPNGLTVIHVERDSIPAVMFTMLIEASPLNEPAEKAGLAYLTARMLTEGTKGMSAKAFSEALDFMGSSLSSSVSSDYTTISMTTLKKDLDKSMSLLSDAILQPAFDTKEIENKKRLIKGYLRQRDEEPSYAAQREFNRIVFGSHPYGRVIEGSAESIDRITREDILSFHSRYYKPQRAILSVAGNIKAEELEALIKRHLENWTNTDSEKENMAYQEHLTETLKEKTVLINRDITQANILLGHRGIKRSDPDYYAVSVMNYILGGGGFASRLMKIVRDELGLTYGISSYFTMNKDKGGFQVEVQTKNEFAGKVVGEIVKQMVKIQNEPVSDEELSDAKSFLIGSFPRRMETNRKIADFLATAYFFRLGDDYIKSYPGYINSVTKEDVTRAAKRYLHPEDYILVITGKDDIIKGEIKGSR